MDGQEDESEAQRELMVNPLPPMVVALALAMAGVEIVLQAAEAGLIARGADAGWRVAWIERFGFQADLLDQMIARGVWHWDVVLRLVSYPFLHAGATHAIIAVVFVLALGKVVGEKFGNAALLALFLASSAGGALVFWAVADSSMWIIGGLPGAYGLIGGFSFLLWAGLGAAGENRMRAFTLIGALMAIQLVFGLLLGGGRDWIADLGGFLTGFLLSFLVSPGGWSRALNRLRQRD